MGIALFALLCGLVSIRFIFHIKALERRAALQRELPREQLMPRHYKLYTEIESRLWAASQEQKHLMAWEKTRFSKNQPGFDIVREYLLGLREDFERGHRIFGRIIVHSPEVGLFNQLEWERRKIEFSYYRQILLVEIRLRIGGASIEELRQLTDIIATLAYRVRSMLRSLENNGNMEFVDSILRQS